MFFRLRWLYFSATCWISLNCFFGHRCKHTLADRLFHRVFHVIAWDQSDAELPFAGSSIRFVCARDVRAFWAHRETDEDGIRRRLRRIECCIFIAVPGRNRRSRARDRVRHALHRYGDAAFREPIEQPLRFPENDGNQRTRVTQWLPPARQPLLSSKVRMSPTKMNKRKESIFLMRHTAKKMNNYKEFISTARNVIKNMNKCKESILYRRMLLRNALVIKRMIFVFKKCCSTNVLNENKFFYGKGLHAFVGSANMLFIVMLLKVRQTKLIRDDVHHLVLV